MPPSVSLLDLLHQSSRSLVVRIDQRVVCPDRQLGVTAQDLQVATSATLWKVNFWVGEGFLRRWIRFRHLRDVLGYFLHPPAVAVSYCKVRSASRIGMMPLLSTNSVGLVSIVRPCERAMAKKHG